MSVLSAPAKNDPAAAGSNGPVLQTAEFEFLRRFVLEHCGISLGDHKHQLVQGRLQRRLRALRLRDFADYCDVLRHDPQSELGELASAISTNVTSFFREVHHYELLENELLPAWLAHKQRAGDRLRIWSAGCSSGEEPYALAMVLAEALARNNSTLDAKILATGSRQNVEFFRLQQRAGRTTGGFDLGCTGRDQIGEARHLRVEVEVVVPGAVGEGDVGRRDVDAAEAEQIAGLCRNVGGRGGQGGKQQRRSAQGRKQSHGLRVFDWRGTGESVARQNARCLGRPQGKRASGTRKIWRVDDLHRIHGAGPAGALDAASGFLYGSATIPGHFRPTCGARSPRWVLFDRIMLNGTAL